MRPTNAICVCAHAQRLVFDLPIGPGERGVANLLPDPESEAWGVAYQISLDQAEWLDRTEGVPAGGYRRVSLEVTTLDGETLVAYTYSSHRGVHGRKPSPRYMGIVLAGARHHGLPADWIAWLASLDLAVDEREPARPVSSAC